MRERDRDEDGERGGRRRPLDVLERGDSRLDVAREHPGPVGERTHVCHPITA